MSLLNQTSRIGTLHRLKKVTYSFVNFYLQVNNKASNIACRAELGRYPLILDINKRILKYISYLQSKEQSSLVIQSLVMSIDLHRNGKTSFYTNLKKILDYYNISFNFNYENLDDMKIMHFVNRMQKKYITHWRHALCNLQKLEFYND